MDTDRPFPAPFTPNLSHLSNFDPTHESPRKRYPHADDKTTSFPRALTQTRNNTENVLVDGNPRKDRPFAFPSRPFASRQSVVNPTKTHNEGRARKIFMLPSEKASQPPKPSVFKFPTPSPSNIARLRHDYSPNTKEELSSGIETNSSPVQSPHRLSPRPLALQDAYSGPFHEHGGDTRLPETAEHHVPPQSSTSSLPSGSAIMISGGGGGFSDIAIKALTESKKVMDDLIQQKSYTDSLLASQKATNERLADALRDCASAKEELSATRSNLSSNQAELASVQALLSQAREDLLTVRAEIARVEQEFSQYRNDTDMARTAIEEERAEKIELRKKLSNAKHKLMGLSKDYVAFREGQLELKSSHETLKLTLERTLRELLELNRTTGDGLASTRPFLTEGGHLAQANQLKDVISELQDSLTEAHRVTDLLRDKLHHTLGQLAESMAKVSELEHERKQGWNERVVLGRNLDRFETKFEELTGRIIKREEESLEVLAEAAVAEAKATTAAEKFDRLHETQITLKKKEEELNELVDVRNENAKIQVQLGSEERKSSEISAKLLETENALRCQEREMITLQSELKLLKSNREELRLSLNESEAIAQTSKEELASMIFKETVTTKKNDAMEAEVSRMKTEVIHLNECLRQSNSQLGIIQDRFDSQAVTLRLAKEDSGHLQERLFQRETTFASKTGALEIDLAVLREQKLTLETQLGELREELKKQRATFIDASAEFERRIAKQEATSSRVLEMQEQRANRAENDVTDTKRRLVEIQSRVEVAEAAKLQLEGCVEVHSARLENEIAASKRLTEEMTTLKEEVMALQRNNAEFAQRTKDLKSRYDSGDLTDDEKEFVTALITATQSIHEQDTVSRCNELRRSENMIQTLQARIRTLESTLARVLKEKEQDADPESKPMVDLRSWISSSPPDAETVMPHHKTGVSNAEVWGALDPVLIVCPPTTTPEPQFSAVPGAQLRAEPIPPSPPTIAPRFTMLSGMDTDDDAPLSEPPMSPAIALGKRERVGSPTKNEDSRRSGRRVKGPTTRASGPPVGDSAQSSRPNQKKPAAEPSAKTRARKRK